MDSSLLRCIGAGPGADLSVGACVALLCAGPTTATSLATVWGLSCESTTTSTARHAAWTTRCDKTRLVWGWFQGSGPTPAQARPQHRPDPSTSQGAHGLFVTVPGFSFVADRQAAWLSGCCHNSHGGCRNAAVLGCGAAVLQQILEAGCRHLSRTVACTTAIKGCCGCRSTAVLGLGAAVLQQAPEAVCRHLSRSVACTTAITGRCGCRITAVLGL
jgi:hypothetical protein